MPGNACGVEGFFVVAVWSGSSAGLLSCHDVTIVATHLFLSFFHITSSLWTSSLPSCLWSLRILPSLSGSRLTFFLSRCKFSTLTARQPMVEFYLLTFSSFPLRKKDNKFCFDKNRTHDFRNSRCAGYLLDHTADEGSRDTFNSNSRMK